MFRPQIQKSRVMVGLMILVMTMVYWATNSYERKPTYAFDIKKKTVELMEVSIETLRSEVIKRKINSGEDSISFGSFLLGPGKSIIQTTSGSFISKQSVLNPDFGAMIVEMLIELEIEKGDQVAISYTGSYPGANLAVLSALEAMDVSAVIISSCGSSEYGATHPEFTWIDMERHLVEKKVFSNTSSLASIGGGFDLGTQLGTRGKKVCESSIYNNKIDLLNIDNASENIQKRMNHFTSIKGELSLFINVGGGVYSIGDSLLRSNTPAGIIYPGDGDFSGNSDETVIGNFLDRGIPVLNINHINILSEWYELPYPPKRNYRYGVGSLFYSQKQYNPLVILIAFFISIGAVLTVGIISHSEIKRRMYSSEPESLL